MIVMPANATGWFWHCLARETGRIGHLYSPGAERGPWPWFPFALDNGAFSCWDMATNTFDDESWAETLPKWRKMLAWASPNIDGVRWAIVPDVPGNRERTIDRWAQYAPIVQAHRIPLAVAVQDGMTTEDVKALRPRPEVIAVGGSDEFKQGTVQMWAQDFDRVHVLRCNSPAWLDILEAIGIESCDGTGWNRGDRKQTAGLERWARKNPVPRVDDLAPFVCRGKKTLQMQWGF